MVLIALTIIEKKKEKLHVKKIFQHLDLNKKHVLFKRALFVFLMLGISRGFITSYVFPLFLQEVGFDVKVIGTLLGIQGVLIGFSVFYLGKLKRKFLFYWALFYSFILFLIGISAIILEITLVGFLVTIFGITQGIRVVFEEDIFSQITKDGSYSTDIALLATGFHFGSTISLALSGFLITLYGFSPVFLLSALIFLISAFYIYNTFHKKIGII